jgi:hypothetical protein
VSFSGPYDHVACQHVSYLDHFAATRVLHGVRPCLDECDQFVIRGDGLVRGLELGDLCPQEFFDLVVLALKHDVFGTE